jgi:hypothetical protein
MAIFVTSTVALKDIAQSNENENEIITNLEKLNLGKLG